MAFITADDTKAMTPEVAIDIIREAKSLLDLASKGLEPGKDKDVLKDVRGKLWGIVRRNK